MWAVRGQAPTSLAALIGHRNQNTSGHILTIEDLLEFVHEHDKCVITQREVGIDTHSFDEALKVLCDKRLVILIMKLLNGNDGICHVVR